MWRRRGSVSPFVKLPFREQELNWLFTKYKRLENNPLYGICGAYNNMYLDIQLDLATSVIWSIKQDLYIIQ